MEFCKFPPICYSYSPQNLFFALFNFNHRPEISTLLLKPTVKGHVTQPKYEAMISLMVKNNTKLRITMFDLLRVKWHFSESGFDELRVLTVI